MRLRNVLLTGSLLLTTVLTAQGVWQDYRGVWHFGDNWNDYSPNGYNATGVGAVLTENAEGPVARLDGQADYIEVAGSPDATVLNFSSSFSIEAQIKPDDLTSERTIVAKGTDAASCNYRMSISATTVALDIGGSSYSMDTLSLSADEYYYVVGVFDDANNTVRIYINGILVKDTSALASPSGNSSSLFIGKTGSGTYFDGDIDEIRIAPKVLSTNEVLFNYAAIKKDNVSSGKVELPSFQMAQAVYYAKGTRSTADDELVIEFTSGVDDSKIDFENAQAVDYFDIIGTGALDNATLATGEYTNDNLLVIQMPESAQVAAHLRSEILVKRGSLTDVDGAFVTGSQIPVTTMNVTNVTSVKTYGTIKEAIEECANGDSILVLDDGYYTDTLNFSANNCAPIIVGAGAAPPSIKFDGIGMDEHAAWQGDDLMVFAGQSYGIEFKNIIWDGVSAAGDTASRFGFIGVGSIRDCQFKSAGVYYHKSGTITVDNCEITGKGIARWESKLATSSLTNCRFHDIVINSPNLSGALNVYGGENSLFAGNTFSDIEGPAIFMRCAKANIFKNNLIYDVDGTAICQYSTITEDLPVFNKYYNNTIYGCEKGVELDSMPKVVNNIIYGCTDWQIYLNSKATLDPDSIKNNLVSLTNSNLVSIISGTANITDGSDPKFVDPANGDFSLDVHSPCVNASDYDADSAAAYALTTDLAGNTRPMPVGSMMDMGALEEQTAMPLVITKVEYYSYGTQAVADDKIVVTFNAALNDDSLDIGQGRAHNSFFVTGAGNIGNATLSTGDVVNDNILVIEMETGDAPLSHTRSILQISAGAATSMAGITIDQINTAPTITYNVFVKSSYMSYQTLAEAYANAMSVDEIRICDAGIYEEFIDINKELAIIGYGDGTSRPTWQNDGDTTIANLNVSCSISGVKCSQRSTKNVFAFGKSSSYWYTFDDCAIDGNDTSLGFISIGTYYHCNVTVQNCDIKGIVRKVYYSRSEGTQVIKNNRIHDCYAGEWTGLLGFYSAKNFEVTGNELYNISSNQYNTIGLRYASDGKITGNLLYNCKKGIGYYYNTNPNKRNMIAFNTVVNCTLTGIFVNTEASDPDTVKYNISWNNGGRDLDYNSANAAPVADYNCYKDIDSTDQWPTETNGFSQDPLFTNVSNNDFTLQSTSPCLGKSDVSGEFTDLAGNGRPRPEGSMADLGCYEEQSTFPSGYQSSTGIFVSKSGSGTAPYDTPDKATSDVAVAFNALTSTRNTVIFYEGGTYAEAHPCSINVENAVIKVREGIVCTLARTSGSTDSTAVIKIKANKASIHDLAINGNGIASCGVMMKKTNPTGMVMDGLDIFGISNYGNFWTVGSAGIYFGDNYSSATILHCKIHDFVAGNNNVYRQGIMIKDNTGRTGKHEIAYCEFYNLPYAIYRKEGGSNSGGNAYIHHNLIYDCYSGITSADTLGKDTVIYNTIANCTNTGISMSGWDSTSIGNFNMYAYNIVTGCGTDFKSNAHDNGYYFGFNCYGTLETGIDPGPGDVTQDPLFVNEQDDDYRLALNSPCIDASYNSAANVDIAGTVTPLGAYNDIGAYEIDAGPDTIAPDVPDTLLINVSGDYINLTWAKVADPRYDLAGYYVYRSVQQGLNYQQVGSVEDDTAYTDSAATAGIMYYYVVSAVDNKGNKSGYTNEVCDSVAVTDTTAPEAPGSLVLKEWPNRIALEWTASANSEGDLQGYKVYRSLQTGTGFSALATVYWDDLDYDDLTAGLDTTYYYHVKAVDAFGNESTPTTELSGKRDVVAPESVANVIAEYGNRKIMLDWNVSADTTGDLEGYAVYRKTGAETLYNVIALPGTDTTYTDTGVTYNNAYSYGVGAYDSAGNVSPLTTLSITAIDTYPPAAPESLQLANSDTGIVLTWQESENRIGDLALYRIIRSAVSGSNYVSVNAVPGSTLTYTDGGIQINTTYYYLVLAEDTTGNAGVSAEVSGTWVDTVAPPVPSGFAVTGNDTFKSVAVQWDSTYNPEGVLDGWIIYRSYGAASGYAVMDTVGIYDTLYLDESVAQETTYYYKMTALGDNGYQSQETTPISVRLGYLDITPPEPAVHLISAVINDTTVLTWSASPDSAGDLSGYAVSISNAAMDPDSFLIDVGNALTYIDTSAIPESLYYYEVYAYDTAGNLSEPSNMVSSDTTDTTGPEAPATLFGATYYYGLSLQWPASANSAGDLEGYRIYQSFEPDSGFEIVYTGQDTQYSDTTIAGNVDYYYYLSVFDEDSNYSYTDTTVHLRYIDSIAPVPSGSLYASLDNGYVDLIWYSSADTGRDFIGYMLYKSTDTSFSANFTSRIITDTATIDSGFYSNRTYYYQVGAIDQGNNISALSNRVAVAIPSDTSAPAAPGNLASTSFAGQVVLVWNRVQEDDVVGYDVYQSQTSGSGYAKITASSIVDTSFTDTSGTDANTYYYIVKAVDGGDNESPGSNEVWGYFDKSAPNTITGVNTSPAENSITITWTVSDTPGDFKGYRIYRGIPGDALLTVLQDSLTVQMYNDTAVSKYTSYIYTVAAFDTMGNFGYTVEDTSDILVDTTAPDSPQNCKADFDGEVVTVTWNASQNTAGDLFCYSVIRRIENDTNLIVIADSIFDTTYTDPYVAADRVYYYSIAAKDTSGNYSSLSNEDGTVAWWDQDWGMRRKMEIAGNVNTDTLYNIPLLIKIPAGDTLYSLANTNGEDIRITNGKGSAVLNHEIQSWSSNDTSYIWVKVDTLPDSAYVSCLWIYFNNPNAADGQNASGVWSDGYTGVWHLDETVTDEAETGSHTDVMGLNNGTQHRNSPVAGILGQGQFFDGTGDADSAGDYIDLGMATFGIDNSNEYTIEMWVKVEGDNDSAAYDAIIQRGDYNNPFRIDVKSGLGIRSGVRTEASNYGSSTSELDTVNWYHLAITFKDSINSIYINGDLDAAFNGGGILSVTTGENTYLGSGVLGNDFYWGSVDELKIADKALDAQWIKMQYRAIKSTVIESQNQLHILNVE